MKLTDRQAATLYDVRDGKVVMTKNYKVTGAHAGVVRRLETLGLVEPDWTAPVGLSERSPAYYRRYAVKITTAGTKALDRRRCEVSA